MYKFWLSMDERRRLNEERKLEEARKLLRNLPEAISALLLYSDYQDGSAWHQWKTGSDARKDLDKLIAEASDTQVRYWYMSLTGNWIW